MKIPEFSFASLNSARSSKAFEIRLCLNLPKSKKQLDEIFSFRNLAELVFDISEGFGEIPESIKNAKKLRYLRFENSSKSPVVLEFPKIFLELPQLKSLQFINCRNLTWGKHEWGGLTSLRQFYTYFGGETFPMGLFELEKLEWLDISTNLYPEIPAEIGQLKKLKSLYVNAQENPNKKIPSVVATLPLLEKLNIWVQEVPDWIADCNPHLKSLSIYPIKEKADISDKIFDYLDLDVLSLYNLGIKELSPKIGQLSKLRILILSGNLLTNLPAELTNLHLLEHLILNYNPFIKLPGVLAKIPNLKNLEIKQYSTHSSEISRFEKFLNWFKINNCTPELRNFLADRWDGKPIDPENLKDEFVTKALFIGLSPIGTHMLNSLTKESKQAYRPLKSGDVLLIDGKTSMKKTELKIKLKAMGVEIGAELDEKTTHFLIDEKCQIYPFLWLGKEHLCLMTDKQLVDFLNDTQPDYLVEDANQHANSQMVENTNLMLLSLEMGNIGVALNLLKTGGVPEGCKTGLFVVYKLAEDSKHRSLAGKLLQQAASPELRDAMKKRVIFHDIDFASYLTMDGYFSAFEHTEIDMLRFALIYHRIAKKKNDILYYLLRRGNSDALREYFKSQIQNGHLRVHISYNREGVHFMPKEIFDCVEITHLNIYMYFSQNTTDDVFYEEFTKLINLQRLDIFVANKIFTEIPPVLKKLTWLKELKSNLPQELKDELKTFLPHCQIEK